MSRNVDRLLNLWALVSFIGWAAFWVWVSAGSWGAWIWLPVLSCWAPTLGATGALYWRWTRPRQPDFTYRGWA